MRSKKILLDYDGDAQRIKDLARNTILVREDQVTALADLFRQYGANIKVIEPSSNSLGYRGVNATYMTASGIMAETQISTPLMIYAKFRAEKARHILGAAQYDCIEFHTGVPGGVGRELYTRWRTLSPQSIKAQQLAQQSREYYRMFEPTDGNTALACDFVFDVSEGSASRGTKNSDF